MTFAAGAIVGLVVGFLAASLLARRRSGSPHNAARGGTDRGLTIATAIAVIALVVAVLALARSDQDDGNRSTTTNAATTSPSSLAPTTSIGASTTSSPATVAVPNVVGLSRSDAEAALTGAGLRSSIDMLTLANVPAGFVISQNPLTASVVAKGSTVKLVVSAAG